ncbi:MAG: hypothetical protein Q8M92_06470, partial [Candidatus Subteraquimicrobiales bacterium]|nr:hypothetical protein [Candidatus Subteraquimicrobiales bacterium]
KLIGIINVDSGLVWIGDPCYTLHKEPKEIGKTWGEFCEKLVEQDGESGPPTRAMFKHDNGKKGLGICASVCGDGGYRVVENLDEYGRTKSIEILFEDENVYCLRCGCAITETRIIGLWDYTCGCEETEECLHPRPLVSKKDFQERLCHNGVEDWEDLIEVQEEE